MEIYLTDMHYFSPSNKNITLQLGSKVWLLLARGYDFYNRRGLFHPNNDPGSYSCSIYGRSYSLFVQTLQDTPLRAVATGKCAPTGDIANYTLGEYARFLMRDDIDADKYAHCIKPVGDYVKNRLGDYYRRNACERDFKRYVREVNGGTLRNWTFFRSVEFVSLSDTAPPQTKII